MGTFQRVNTFLLVICLLAVSFGTSFARRFDEQIVPRTLNLPSSVVTGDSFTGTVIMSGTAASSTTVSLSTSSGSAVTIPSSVTVPQGSDRASFSATANSSGTISITASANGGSASDYTLSGDFD